MSLGSTLSKKEGRLTIPTEVEKKDSKLDPYPWSSTFQDLTVRKGFFCEDKTRVLLIPMIFLNKDFEWRFKVGFKYERDEVSFLTTLEIGSSLELAKCDK